MGVAEDAHGALLMTESLDSGEAASEAVPTPPETTPSLPNWPAERDSVHVWSEINKLNLSFGEIKTNIAGLQASVKSLQGDMDSFKRGLEKAYAFVKGASLVIGLVFAALVWLSTHLWDSVLKPGLAHAVAEQISPIVDKQIKESEADASRKASSLPQTK